MGAGRARLRSTSGVDSGAGHSSPRAKDITKECGRCSIHWRAECLAMILAMTWKPCSKSDKRPHSFLA